MASILDTQVPATLVKCSNPDCDLEVFDTEYCPFCGPGALVDPDETTPDGAIRGPVVLYTAAGYAIWTEQFDGEMKAWIRCERLSEYFKRREDAEKRCSWPYYVDAAEAEGAKGQFLLRGSAE